MNMSLPGDGHHACLANVPSQKVQTMPLLHAASLADPQLVTASDGCQELLGRPEEHDMEMLECFDTPQPLPIREPDHLVPGETVLALVAGHPPQKFLVHLPRLTSLILSCYWRPSCQNMSAWGIFFCVMGGKLLLGHFPLMHVRKLPRVIEGSKRCLHVFLVPMQRA